MMNDDDGVATHCAPVATQSLTAGLLGGQNSLSLCDAEQGKVHTLPALQMYVHVGSGTGSLFFIFQLRWDAAVP